MEFTARSAVLQSALQLSNSYTPGGLVTYTKGQNTAALDIITDAVTELTWMESEARVINRKDKLEIVAVLVVKALSQSSENDTWAEFDAVTYGLPQVSWPLLLDIIKTNKLWGELLHILPCLQGRFALTVVTETLRYLATRPDSDDQCALADLLCYISLTEHSPLYTSMDRSALANKLPSDSYRATKANRSGNIGWNPIGQLLSALAADSDTSRQADMTDFLKLLRPAAQPHTSGISCEAKLGLLALVVNISAPKCAVVCSVEAIETSSEDNGQDPLTVLCNHAANIDSQSTDKEAMHDQILTLVAEVTDDQLPIVEMSHKVPEDLRAEILDSLLAALNQLLDTSDVSKDLKQMTNVNISRYFQGEKEAAQNWLWRRTLLELFRLYNANIKQLCDEINLESLKVVLDYLETLHQELDPAQTDSSSEQDARHRVTVINLRLRGWTRHLQELLETRELEVIRDPQWLDTLQTNVTALQESHMLCAAVETLAWLRSLIGSAQCMVSFQALLLKAFTGSAQSVQNNCLEILSETHTNDNLQQIFGVDITVTNEIRALLNRITSSEGLGKVPDLASFCLQCPQLVAVEMVEAAAQNKGQVSAVVRVFQQLPALTSFGEYKNNVVMLIVNSLAALRRRDASVTSSQEEKNLLQLSKMLLQPTDKTSNPVINPATFLHDFILPNALPSSQAAALSTQTEMWCSLALVALEGLCQVESDWLAMLQEAEPVVLLYVVCQNLNCLADAGMGRVEDGRRGRHLWNEWLRGLELLKVAGQRYPELFPEKDLVWLYQRVATCHWSVPWLCRDLSEKVLGTFPVPKPLLAVLQDTVPDLHGVDSDSADPLLSLLQFIQVSSTTLDFALCHLHQDFPCKDASLEPRLVACLVMLLPRGGTPEWTRLGVGVRLLLERVGCETVGPAEVLQIFLQALWVLQGATKGTMTWRDLASALSGLWVSLVEDTDRTDLCHCLAMYCTLVHQWPDPDFVEQLSTLGLELVSRLKQKQLDVQILEVAEQWVKAASSDELGASLVKALTVDRSAQECLT